MTRLPGCTDNNPEPPRGSRSPPTAARIPRRPDPADRNLDRGIIGCRAQYHGLGRKPRARTQQPFQLAARLQILVTSQRHDHLLTHLLACAAALDNLQIGASGRSLAAKVHGVLRMLVRTQSRDSFEKFNSNPQKTWHYIFVPRPLGTNKINSLCHPPPHEL